MSDGQANRWRDQLRDTFRALGPEDTQPLPRLTHEPLPVPPDLIELLRALGIALLNSSKPTSVTTEVLEDVGAAYDADVIALVFPTGIVFRIGSTELDAVTVSLRSLRLDQVAEVDHLVAVLRRAGISPTAGLQRLEAILTAAPRFRPFVSFLGQLVLSLGFGMLLNPDVRALPAYIGLAAIVGALKLLADKWNTFSIALPVVAAFVVTVLTVTVLVPLTNDDPIRLLTPPLVVFLPGVTLTIATMELASNQMVSGASRMVWGISQLLLLAFGVLAGFGVTGYPEPISERSDLGPWAPWVGVLLVGIGYLYYSSAPRGSLPFLWIALIVSYAAQNAGAILVGGTLSGFVGGVIIAPATQLLARFPKAPPAATLLLPSFWMLVPGSLGLRGFSQAAVGFGAGDLVATGISLFSVALGVLVGTSMTNDVIAIRRSWSPRKR